MQSSFFFSRLISLIFISVFSLISKATCLWICQNSSARDSQFPRSPGIPSHMRSCAGTGGLPRLLVVLYLLSGKCWESKHISNHPRGLLLLTNKRLSLGYSGPQTLVQGLILCLTVTSFSGLGKLLASAYHYCLLQRSWKLQRIPVLNIFRLRNALNEKECISKKKCEESRVACDFQLCCGFYQN